MIRSLLRVAMMMGPTAAFAAEPIVVPEFSFDAGESFALSVMLHAEVQDRLLADGHIVLSQEVVAKEVGEAAVDRCLENPSCPQEILPRLPAQVALLCRISRQGGTLQGHMELWEQSRPTAIDVRDIVIKPGQESQFTDEVAAATAALLRKIPPSSNETLMAAARLISGQPAAAPRPTPAPVVLPAPAPVPVPLPVPVPVPVPGQVSAVTPRPTGAIQPYVPQPAYPQPAYPQPAYPQPGYPQPTYPQPQGGVQPAYPQPGYPQPQPQQGGIQPPYPQPGYPQPVPQPQPVVQPVPVGPAIVDLDGDGKKHRGPTPAKARGGTVDYSGTDLAAALEGTGLKPRHIAGAETSLKNSGMDPRDWLYKAMPHAGRLVVEPHFGMGIGDVDRQADIRVQIVDGTKVDEWYQEGPVPARRIRGGLFVGYAPVAYFDFGALVGLQYGKRYLTTGYHRTLGNDPPEEKSSPLLDVAAVQFVIQPRARAYVVPTGPAKPFVFIGGDFRLFDDYQIAQPPDVQYPVPAGGVVPGFVGGGGLLLDPSPIVGFFVEGSYIRHFGTRAGPAQTKEWPFERPASPVGTESTITVVGGLQFRL